MADSFEEEFKLTAYASEEVQAKLDEVSDSASRELKVYYKSKHPGNGFLTRGIKVIKKDFGGGNIGRIVRVPEGSLFGSRTGVRRQAYAWGNKLVPMRPHKAVEFPMEEIASAYDDGNGGVWH